MSRRFPVSAYPPLVPRLRVTILVKLLLALVLPVVALFTLFAFVAYQVSRHDLDEELGRRLEAIAASAASQLRGKYLAGLGPGDEGEPTYQTYIGKLDAFDNCSRFLHKQRRIFDPLL